MSTPLVSIVTPMLNAGTFIRACGESVLAQTWPNWEWIVVDNHSADNSVTVLKTFLTDPRIIFLEEPEQGVSKARNKALNQASGDFICFLDADDILPTNSLKSRLDVLLQNPECAFADGVVQVRDSDLQQHIRTYKPSFKGPPLDDLLDMSGRSFFGNTWMIRRESNFNFQFDTDLSHAEDLLFYISIAHLGEYDFTEDDVLICRKGHGSAMEDLEAIEKSYSKFILKLEKSGIADFEQIIQVRHKLQTIMLKSWLKAGKPLKAVRLKKHGL